MPNVSRRVCGWAILGMLAGVMGAGSTAAQVTCYRTKCLVYPNGDRLCERTPVDCSTIQL